MNDAARVGGVPDVHVSRHPVEIYNKQRAIK